MKRSVLIGAAALAFACGGGSHQSDTQEGVPSANSAQPTGSAQPGSANAANAQTGGDQGGATQANQTVTLVGCLTGPGQPIEPAGTARARARARATGPDTAVATSGLGASADRF